MFTGASLSVLQEAVKAFPTDAPPCSGVRSGRSPCRCRLEACVGWYPCGLKYCKGRGPPAAAPLSYRCGINTCRRCQLFDYYVHRKHHCLWDEWPATCTGRISTTTSSRPQIILETMMDFLGGPRPRSLSSVWSVLNYDDDDDDYYYSNRFQCCPSPRRKFVGHSHWVQAYFVHTNRWDEILYYNIYAGMFPNNFVGIPGIGEYVFLWL